MFSQDWLKGVAAEQALRMVANCNKVLVFKLDDSQET